MQPTAKQFQEYGANVNYLPKKGVSKDGVKKIIANRKEANAYLNGIQSRINRGHKKGALALLNRWIVISNAVRWEVIAFTDKLDTSPLKPNQGCH